MAYVDYLGNVTRFAVELANAGHADDLSEPNRAMLDDHGVVRPGADDLATLVPLIREALGQIVSGASFSAVSTLLERYRPQLYLSDHDGVAHIHFAHDGIEPTRWIGQTVAAALAHVAAGDPAVTLGRCNAEDCVRFFVDQSRNRTRRFCGNTCASRTTVAAYRARTRS